MRRLLVGFTTSTLLLLALAAPALAAPPLREDGTSTSAFAVASECETTGGGQRCTDTLVDVFQVAPDLWLVCVNRMTYTISRSGQFRPINQESGCTETASNPLTISGDFSSASLAPTEVTFVECNPRGCTERETVTVAVDWTATGEIFTFSNRGTFTDGNCTFRFTSSGQQAQATATITLDGETMEGSGSYVEEEFRFTQRCR